jgi:hypothetical protein
MFKVPTWRSWSRMSAKKSRDEATTAVADLLDPGETVVAVLPFTQVPRQPKGSRYGIRQRSRRYRPLVLTNRRLFILETGRTPRPRMLLAEFPHADVDVVRVTPGRFGLSTMVLDLAGVGEVPFIVGRLEQDDADVLVATLGRAGA